MKKILFSLAIMAAMAGVAHAGVIVDNYIGEQNGNTAGAVGNFRVQTFTPSVAGLGALDSVAANSPLPGLVSLDSVTFLRAVSGTNPESGQAFIDVYEGFGDGGTYLGSSTNSIDVEGSDPLETLMWTFSGLALDSTKEHALVFSTDNVAGKPLSVRLQVARDSSGGFGSSYAGGVASNFSDGNGPVPFDTRFQANMSAIPEPASLALFGIGLFGLVGLGRRR